MRCSKQLLLRKVACSTGRSSHASIMGMASARAKVRLYLTPLQAALNLLPPAAQPSLSIIAAPSPRIWEPIPTEHADPQGDKGLFRA
jgi:hypothetical protein